MKSRHEALADAASQWVQKAEEDLTIAATVLKLGRGCPIDGVGFRT